MSQPDPRSYAVRLNDRSLPWQPGLTLARVLEDQGIAPQTVATAVNGRFVARAQRALIPLEPDDVILTFETIVGG